MGAYLSAPVLTKALTAGETGALRYGGAAHQGWRLSMEDESVACVDCDGSGRTALFALFDGHGGSEARTHSAAGRAGAGAAAPAAPRLPADSAPASHVLTPRAFCGRLRVSQSGTWWRRCAAPRATTPT